MEGREEGWWAGWSEVRDDERGGDDSAAFEHAYGEGKNRGGI